MKRSLLRILIEFKSKLNFTTVVETIIISILPIFLYLHYETIKKIIVNTNTEKTIVALVSLSGVVFTSVIGLIGVLIKQSVDRRTFLLNQQSEKRLRLETAVKIIDLNKTDENKIDSKETKEVSLFALVSLGQIELALNLTDNYWDKGSIHSSVAVKMINSALLENEVSLQQSAVYLLYNNYTKLIYEKDNEGFYFFPDTMNMEWNTNVDYNARRGIMITLMTCFALKPLNFWNKSEQNRFIYTMFKILQEESNERLKLGAAYCLKRRLESVESYKFFPPDIESIETGHILKMATKLVPNLNSLKGKISRKVYDLCEKIANQ